MPRVPLLDNHDQAIIREAVRQSLLRIGTLPTSGEPGVGAPTGSVFFWTTTSAPTGYLLCDGAAVSRATYATLFAVISTTFGAGDGVTTFNLPNMQGRVAVGYDSGQTEFDALAETGGAKTHTLSTAEMPSHTHTQDAHTHTQNSHNHTQDSHNHTQDSHNHTQNSHNHTQDAHTHTQNSHTHGFTDLRGLTTGSATTTRAVTEGSDTSSTATGLLTGATTATNQNATATNQAATATNQATTATNQATTATNQAATATNQNATATNQNTGGGGAHNNLQPYLTLTAIIKT